MTVVGDIYDAVISAIAAELPTFARIPNPYAIDENTALILKKAYGLAIGAGSNTQRYVGCLATWERLFTISLITQVVNTENNASGRANVEKDIDDARDTLFKAFESTYATLSGTVIKAVVLDDTGIQYIDGQQAKFLAIEISLGVEYQESTS